MKNTKYVVTYRMEDGDASEIFAKIMYGKDLAQLVGFCDCIPVEIIEVMEVTYTGILMPVKIGYPCHAPFNRILIEDVCGNIKEYEWPEH